MSKTAAEYRAWLRSDEKPCVLVEIDYMYQVGLGVSAVATRGTLYFSNVPYIDEAASPARAYDSCLLAVPDFERALDRATLRGAVGVSVSGDFVFNNADRRLNRLLYLALDGSDARVAIGRPTWARADFLDLYTVSLVKASAATDQRKVEISASDVSFVLNKRLGGIISVGGTGPDANKLAPLPFGYVVNMAPPLVESTPSFTYRYADRATNASVPVVRADGAVLTGGGTDYTDNGATFTLTANPQNSQITCDTLLYGAGKTAVDYRISDAIEFFIGGEAGLTAAGKFAGAHASYYDSGVTVHPANDYFCQTLLTEQTNAIAWLEDATNTANGFWGQYRDGRFYYGRMRPEALSAIVALSGGRLTVRAEIGIGDLVRNTIKVDHRVPTYVSYQCLARLNQTKQTTFAGSVTAAERAMLEREGLPGEGFGGEEPGTTQYLGAVAGEPYKGGAPELYHLSLSGSNLVRTLISGPDDTSAPDPSGDPTNDMPTMQRRWASIARSQMLPWTEFVDFDALMVAGRADSDGLYELEIGDVVNFTYPHFDLDGGALHQIYKVGFRPMQKRMNLGLTRRRFAGVSGPLPGYELREDGGLELREDGGTEVRE